MNKIIARRGDKGAKVRVIQRILKLYPDGSFGPLTEEAVRHFQRQHHLTEDGIVGLSTWQKLLGDVVMPSKRDITDIIIHCTATPEGKDFTLSTIRKWHWQRGFADIGYHYIIHRNGHVEEGRSVDIVGAHCKGHNAQSIGIAYIGGIGADGKPKDTRTLAQRASLIKLLQTLRKMYPTARIAGHRDYSPDKNHNGELEPWEWTKDCPSFDAEAEYRNIRQQ